ncbi:MAG: SDR family oxidoreductase [Deltaproteobacteria bacterium]|nr:SDR family oxidoreductase [Deltaproteobacteria bacterium]
MENQESVAVVAGGTRGIGRACALALARRGDKVVIAARTQENLENIVRRIQEEGGRAHAIRADLSLPSDVMALFREVDERFGGVRWLVNCAAALGPLKPLIGVDPEEWNQTMAINLTGTYLCCRYAAPGMIRRGGGSIVNVTSGLALRVLSPFGVYSVSKAGVNILTRYLAEELGPSGIRVNAISPGVVDTSMQEEIRTKDPLEIGEEVHRRFVNLKESGQLRPPDDVAQLVLFLTSAESNHLNGQIGRLSDYVAMGWQAPPEIPLH